MTKIIAHRGASGLVKVENTLESFEKAIEIGADMVEFDVRKTKDNILVVYHDKNFEDQPVSWYTYEEMEAVAKKKGFHVPLFVEVLELCKDRIYMDIEVKETGFEHRLVRLLKKTVSYDNYSVKSFKDNVIYRVKELDPNIMTGLLIGYKNANFKRRYNELFPLRRLRRCHADFVSPNSRLLHFFFVNRMRVYGYPIYVWTVNDERTMRRLFGAKVDGIITDRPDIALGLR